MKFFFQALIVSIIFIVNLVSSEDVPTEAEVAKLYVATFNRAPDSAGLLWWTNSSGFKLSEIAQSFFDQDETKSLYPSDTSNRNFIKSVYQNLFNREPDITGWDYWEKELNNGSYSKNLFIQTVINGAKDSADYKDSSILENKNTVGIYFAQAGLNDKDEAKAIMQNVTNEGSSVNAALTRITNNTNITINNIVNNYNHDTCSKDWEIIRDEKCVLKTCESDSYNCPSCEDDEVLGYYNNGYGYCTSENELEITKDENISQNVTNGLLAYYQFENNTLDSSGNGFHGTEKSDLKYTTGAIGNGALFDGINDFVDIDKRLKYPLSEENFIGSVCYYAKGSGTVLGTYRLDSERGGEGHRFGYISSSNVSGDDEYFSHVKVNTTTQPWNQTVKKDTLLNPLEDFNHYCLVMDGKNDEYSFYINGVLESVNHHFNKANTGEQMQTLQIGIYNNGSWAKVYYKGIIDELRIYDRKLTSNEVKSIYSSTSMTLNQNGYKDSSNTFSGIWEGIGTQVGGITWSINMDLTNNKISYPSLDCGGDLVFVKETDTTIEFKEKITYGESNCIDDGTIILELIADDKLSFDWDYKTITAASTLTKVN